MQLSKLQSRGLSALPEFTLHPMAEADLDDIVYYTTVQWGEAQARRYSDELLAAISSVAQGHSKGKSISAALPSLKLVKAEHHVICIAQDSDGPVLVLAVLHERMDFMPRIRKRLRAIGV